MKENESILPARLHLKHEFETENLDKFEYMEKYISDVSYGIPSEKLFPFKRSNAIVHLDQDESQEHTSLLNERLLA